MSNPPILRTVAPAKINWTLEVLGRRLDGYHEIRSVMQTISLEDTLEAWPSSEFALEVLGNGADELAGDDNLVVRAVRAQALYLEACPLALRLTKRIPAAAGLGGGSSDAAAALRLSWLLWGLKDERAQERVAATLGSDVPFFLRGGTQLAAGRGEIVVSLPETTHRSLVLLTPTIALTSKTASLYAQLTSADFTAGEASIALARKLREGGKPDGRDYINVFDRPAERVFPSLGRYRRLLEEVAGRPAYLAGAGPTLFALCKDRRAAERARDALIRQGLKAYSAWTTGAVQIPSV